MNLARYKAVVVMGLITSIATMLTSIVLAWIAGWPVTETVTLSAIYLGTGVGLIVEVFLMWRYPERYLP